MKTRFDNRQLAHVWAQQNQPHGSGSNFFFDGPSIYSYGRHFEIARFVTRKGQRCVLFTTRSYSNSTSKHLAFARYALHGNELVFHVADIGSAAAGNARMDYEHRIAAALTSAGNRRSASLAISDTDRAQALTDEANGYAAFFGKRWRIAPPVVNLEALRERAAAERAREAAATRKADAKRDAEYQKALGEWRRHERDHVPYMLDKPTALRVAQSANGPAYIETSRGASVPATCARMVWDAVQEARAINGVQFAANARPRLGSFTLDAIDAAGNVTAGCHVLPYAELHALAVRFGFEVQS
jgi:hypothetical protein